MNHATLLSLLRQGRVSVPVVGDMMLDRYWYGPAKLVQGEGGGKVVAYHVEAEHDLVGGAANVSRNILRLGGTTSLFSVIGTGRDAQDLRQSLHVASINTGLLTLEGRVTTVKIRTGTPGRDLSDVRFDFEQTDPIAPEDARQLARKIDSVAGQHSTLVVSDYAKGVVTLALIDELRTLRRQKGLRIVVDPKPLGGKRTELYHGFDWLTPNLHELGEMTGLSTENPEEIFRAAQSVAQHLECNMLVTLGKDGMLLLEREKDPQWIAGHPVPIANTIGAGDTVIAAFSVCLAAGAPALFAAEVANLAASLAVSKHETDAVELDELQKAMDSE